MGQNRIPVTLSLPPDLAKQFGKLAKEEAKNKSQLFRDMFRAFQRLRSEREFFELQRYGAEQARKKKILTEAQVEKIVFEGR
jgi:metal-responsive CopG/Arc/MetJ family transcriptional regulator